MIPSTGLAKPFYIKNFQINTTKREADICLKKATKGWMIHVFCASIFAISNKTTCCYSKSPSEQTHTMIKLSQQICSGLDESNVPCAISYYTVKRHGKRKVNCYSI